MKRLIVMLLVLVGLIGGAVPVGAQDNGTDLTLPADLLVLMPDNNAIRQVFRFSAESDTLQKLSNAPVDVESFDVWNDDVVYIAGESLVINDEPVQALYRPQGLYTRVHFSPTGDEISYADETGLYILNRETGESELLIEQLDFLNPDNPNGVGDGRLYYEARFMDGSPKLIISVGIWEVGTAAIFDRETSELTELVEGWNQPTIAFRLFNRVIPLSDGRVMLHNSDGRGCSPCGIWVAPSLDAMTDYEQVIDRAALDLSGIGEGIPIPYIHDMLEVSPGVIRILIEKYNAADGGTTSTTVVADIDLETKTIVERSVIDPAAAPYQTMFSADGRLLVGLTDVDYATSPYVGWVTIMDAETGEMTVLRDLPQVSAPLQWAE